MNKTELKPADFTIFGFTTRPDMLEERLSTRLGIAPKKINFGNAGQFFIYTSYGDVAETEQALALKLGFVRSLTKSPLSAQQLLDQKTITPQTVNNDVIRGNTLTACFSKTSLNFTVYKSLLSLPQLYYTTFDGNFLGADNLKCLVTLLERIELNEEIIPGHFLYNHVPGNQTYFRGVYRLLSGQLLKWTEGRVEITLVQDLRFSESTQSFKQINSQSVNVLYQELKDILGVYIRQIKDSGNGFANLLSGGVDSSVLQLTINECIAPSPAMSFSVAPSQATSLQFEIEYARQASAILKTNHTFIEMTPENYVDFLVKSIELLGQPTYLDAFPGHLAIAESQHVKDLRFFFAGHGADTLLGLDIAKKLKKLELLRQIPGSRWALAGVGSILKPFKHRSQQFLNAAAMLANKPDDFIDLTNKIVHLDVNLVRRFLGDQTLSKALEARRNLETEYLNSKYCPEKVHIINLLTSAYESQVQHGQLFLAYQKEQICPYLDEDIIRMSFVFRPEIRYIQGSRVKPILKEILKQRGLAMIAQKPKGGSAYSPDVFEWMKSGCLRQLIQEIERPGFLSKADLEELLKRSDWWNVHYFLWNLLTFDIFQKKILAGRG
jgi:asparagine synthetase B (glutamine-hydrolysing)